MALVKPTPRLIIPGTDAVPGSPASTSCMPPPPGSGDEPTPDPAPEEPVPHYLYVPNDPDDFNAGEVRTPWYGETPEGYSCSTGTFIDIYTFSNGMVVSIIYIETRCYWNYP